MWNFVYWIGIIFDTLMTIGSACSIIMEMIQNRKQKKNHGISKNKSFLFVLGLVILFGVVTYRNENFVRVPDVTGISYENAKIELGNYGLRYTMYEQAEDKIVVSQSINEGESVPKKTCIELELASFAEIVEQTVSETIATQIESEIYSEEIISEDSTELQSETEESTEEINYFDSFNKKENHTPDDAMNVLRTDYWNVDSDIDVRGLTYEDGFLYTVYNALSVMGGNSADPIDSVLAYIYKPGTSKPSLLTGDIVLHNDSYGTDAYAEFSAWVDGEEVWTSPTTLTGTTIEPISMSIDLSNMEYGFEIHAHCVPNGDGIKFAIVNWVFE